MSDRDEQFYFAGLVRAFVGAELRARGWNRLPEEWDELLDAAAGEGIDIHFLKRLANPRILRVAGILEGLLPSSLLDVGAGKGYLLWHLAERLPGVRMTAVDILLSRTERLRRVAASAGLPLSAAQASGEELPFAAGSFPAVTLLEVLEHVPEPGRVVEEACRVSSSWVIASVPGRPDDNPEHIHLFSRETLERLFRQGGAGSVRIERDRHHHYVLGRV